MAIVIRSLYGWWFLLAAIAGSMLAMAGTSVGGTIANPQSAAVHGTTGSGSMPPRTTCRFPAANGTPRLFSDPDRIAGHTCFGPYTSACKCRWTPLAAAAVDANRLLGKNAQAHTWNGRCACPTPACA